METLPSDGNATHLSLQRWEPKHHILLITWSPTPNIVPDSYDANNQLIASQSGHLSTCGTTNLQNPSTPPTSLISDDDDDELFAPIAGNPTQTAHDVLDRHPHPIQKCQKPTPISETPESPTPENRGQCDVFRAYGLTSTVATSNYPLLSISTVIQCTQNLTLHAHMKSITCVTRCLICSKPYDQVIEETVADYLHRTAEPWESVKDRVLKRNAFLDRLQSGNNSQEKMVIGYMTVLITILCPPKFNSNPTLSIYFITILQNKNFALYHWLNLALKLLGEREIGLILTTWILLRFFN